MNPAQIAIIKFHVQKINDSFKRFNSLAAPPLDSNMPSSNKICLISSVENFQIEVGPKVIEASSILKNVIKFTASDEPIEVKMTQKQLEKFVQLHEDLNDDVDKEEPYLIKRFFSKMTDEEFKQLCWAADFLDSQKFLNYAAKYIFIKLENMKIEDFQKFLNIVDDYIEEERIELKTEPLKYFVNCSFDKNVLFEKHDEDGFKYNVVQLPLTLLQNAEEEFTFEQQNFELPKSLINFTFTTSMIPKDLFLKLYSTCKYFFAKLKHIPCKLLRAGTPRTTNTLRIMYGKESIEIPVEILKDFNANFCVVHEFGVDQEFSPAYFNDLYKKIIPYNIYITGVTNPNLILTVNEFKYLFSKAKHVTFRVKVVDSNGDTVPVEELLSFMPDAYNFKYFPTSPDCYTSETTQKIAALKRNVRLFTFEIHDIPSNFNATGFTKFIKNNAKLPWDSSFLTYEGDFFLFFDETVDEKIIVNFKNIVMKKIDSMEMRPIIVFRNLKQIYFRSTLYPDWIFKNLK